MPTVEVDGQRIEVEDGVTVIQAADRLGIEIPHYCWHPGLTIAGNCRMCLVEIEKAPKLQIACNTRVTDGMVVHTKSEKTKTAQKAVLEFLLINHPIDCPICDQAGECKLQEYYMDYDRQDSRVPLSGKVHKAKAIPIGPHVMLDQERCVLCSRCIRFLDEVTKTHELAFYERGDHNELALAPGKTLDNPYSDERRRHLSRRARSPTATSGSARASGTSSARSRSARVAPTAATSRSTTARGASSATCRASIRT